MTQAEALDILKMGKNVFLTGPAGSGKTYVLNEYVNYLRSHAVEVAVTASTGIAATHLGGMTIHSWSGLGIRDRLTDYDIEDLMDRQYLFKRFERTKVLIIDEVSMLHHFRLDMIEWICRQFKRSERPFGGMQVIVSGDFFQLPPVSRGTQSQSEFAYKAESWTRSGFTVCYLSEQHRQKDNEYLNILNEIRRNSVSEKTHALLASRMNKDPESGAVPTKVFTHNIDVDVINNKHLDLISGKSKQYVMVTKGRGMLAETLKKSCLSPEVLTLKVGARVMFTKNQMTMTEGEPRYVNGTLGVVESFNSYGDPVVKTVSGHTFDVQPASWKIDEEGKTKAEISQLPLRLAWAITVHKSQGMSLDAMEVDLSKSFVAGMGYVALSRVRSLAGMKLLGLNDMALRVDAEVYERDLEFQKLSDTAVARLADMSRAEISAEQKSWMKKIEPEEKIKIKILRKRQPLEASSGRMTKKKEQKKSTEELTEEFLRDGVPLEEIAGKRGLKQETIVSHIETLLAEKPDTCPSIAYLRQEFKRGELDTILEAFAKAKTKILAPVFNILTKQKKSPTYLKIRLARLFLDNR